MNLKNIIPLLFCLFIFISNATAQPGNDTPTIDYSEPKEYEIGGITVVGANYSDETAIKSLAGLKVGEKIRIGSGGYDVARAIKALWKLRLFTNVEIYQTKTIGDIVMLEIAVKERPRLSRYSYRGAKKSYHDDMNDILDGPLRKGSIITENTKINSINGIKKFFAEKGYLDAEVKVEEIPEETPPNSVRLVFDIDRKERIKIQDITFTGNTQVKDRKLRKLMKETRRKKHLFSSSKLIDEEYQNDKKKLVAY